MPRWTPEARERQRQLIRNWQPWEHSTGPTSDYGKSVSSQNCYYCTEEGKQMGAIHRTLKANLKRGGSVAQLALVAKTWEQILKSHK